MKNEEHGSLASANDVPQLAPETQRDVPFSDPKSEKALVGIGGWLILPAIGIVVSILFLPISIYLQNAQVLEYWQELTNPLSNAYIPLFKELMYFEMLGNGILYLTLLFLGYVFFTKKKLTVRVFIFLQLFSLALTVTDIILATTLLDLTIDDSDIIDILRTVISCAIWLPYFLVSKRVKNTFVNE